MVHRRDYLLVTWQTSRPDQMLLVVGVYLLGATVAVANGAQFDTGRLWIGALPLLALAASIHYANEYADYETDALTDRTPFSGGSGALQRTDVPRTYTLWLAITTLFVGAILSIILAAADVLTTAGFVLLVVATVFGWQYSVGPLKLAWRGFGEVTNAALGGLCLPLYGAAVLGGPLGTVAIAAIPFFLLVLLNLFATQWPDRHADGAVGKNTLAVKWPRRRLRRTYVGIAILAGISLLAVHVVVVPRLIVLASLPVVPLVVVGALGYTKRHVPWATVAAMVALAACHFTGWAWLAWG
jgi:1,4-dihydroxy-2-naphthoate octaprenyltransferase